MQTVRRLGRRNVGRHCFTKSKKKKKKKKKFFFFFPFVFFVLFTHATRARCNGGRKRRGTEKSKRGHFKILTNSKHTNIDQSNGKLSRAASSAQTHNSNFDAKQKLLKTSSEKKTTNQKTKNIKQTTKIEIKLKG
jgi:hypothetical protein